MFGDDVQWGLEAHLLATVADFVAAGNWQRAGNKSAKRPSPIPRPGIAEPPRDEKRIGGDVVRTPAEIDAIFAATETPEEVTDGS